MAKTKIVRRGPFAATAATLSEARADVERQIDRSLAADYRPIVLAYAGETWIGWRDAGGWAYSCGMIEDNRGMTILGADVERADVRRNMARHMAGALTPIPETLASLARPEILTDDRDWVSFRHGMAWQIAMRTLLASGRADNTETRYAADTAARAMLTEGV